MNYTQDYWLWVSFSLRKFDHKPDRETEVSTLSFRRIYTDIDGFARGMAMGYCYAPIFRDATFGMGGKTETTFQYSPFVSIDVDHTLTDMNTMLDRLKYKPTIAYTSCSNTPGDYGYRLIYMFDSEIRGIDEYYSYVYAILSSNGLSIDDVDQHSREAERYYNGNGTGNIETSISYIVYSKDDFKDYYKDYKRPKTEEKHKSANENNILNTQQYYSQLHFVNPEFESDYWNMRMEDVLAKYIDVYPNIEHTPLPDVNDDTPYILFPNDYIEIKRYWKKTNDGRPVKIRDGNCRRNKLFINGVLRRRINPDITFDNLLYNLLYELYYYISNYEAKNIIGKKEIYEIAKSVMDADPSRIDIIKPKRKFMVNREYCIKHNLTPNQVKNIAAKAIRNEEIGELYDCSLTDDQNINVMKENGLTISLRTLKNWRKENGITRYGKKASRDF